MSNPDRDGAEPAGETYRQIRFAAPAMATEILLVRHGETIAADPDSPFPLLDGHGDPELAPEGQKQAEQIADHLAGTKVDAIYVTTLRRTAETAAPLAERLGLEPIVEPDLREVLLGEWEGGIYRQRVLSGDPLALEMFDKQRWDVVPGAESNKALRARVQRAVERIAAAQPGKRVVVVSHGGAIGMVLAIATESRPFAFVGGDNGSISRIVVAADHWHLRGFNDVCHLS
jgi:probable phosphoglycerate mutase